MEHPAAKLVKRAERSYRGVLTTPERWETWTPRDGDVLVCTPPKCGTTWTQTMIAMFLNNGTDLPESVSVLSPWVDAALGDESEVAATLERQSGRRVVKTHTPADGYHVWDGVTVIAVYRHPLDIFFSLRKHAQNMKNNPDHPMRRPLEEALTRYLHEPYDPEDFDRDTLATITHHYDATVLKVRLPDVFPFHYADMIADQHRTARRLAEIVGLSGSDDLVDQVASATGFEKMRAEAHKFVPEGGKGFWSSDAAFFDSGGTHKWRGKVSEKNLAIYEARLAELVPDPAARRWLEFGERAEEQS